MRILEAGSIPPGELVDRVAEEVFAGRTVIFPTDTLYGLGCDPVQPQAVSRLYALKVRDAGKPLTLHLASALEALEYAAGNALAKRAIESFLPGPLTVIVLRPRHVDPAVTAGLPSLGVRVPGHPLCVAILERCGPLAATSANYGGRPAFTGEGARGELPPADLLVDAGPTPLRAPSSVLDCTGGVPRLVREGVLTVETLEATLGRIERPSAEGNA
ncbi:MAG: L-threonylcarbamoyladenylate synthase [Candidatus Baltobacteraceae bacterium]